MFSIANSPLVPDFVKRHWLTIMFLGGFVTDFILLNRIDDKFDNAVLFFYVAMATISLILFYAGVADRISSTMAGRLVRYMPMLMQYSFGGLLSGMLIFYGRSGDLINSAPFLALILLVIFTNELVKKRSDRLIFNISVYFIGIFSYCVLIVPVWLGKTGDFIFIGSGLLALALTMFLIKMLKQVIPNFMTLEKRMVVFCVGSLYALFNTLYFLNVIPPIPLSLTELGVFQSVERTVDGNYRIMKEQGVWMDRIPFVTFDFNPLPGQGAFCFARVYAPTNLHTNVVHRWQYKNAEGAWIDHYSHTYAITGENKGGYRGYTTIKNIHDGVWRCSVENERGQVLGRYTFTVDTKTAPKDIVTVLE